MFHDILDSYVMDVKGLFAAYNLDKTPKEIKAELDGTRTATPKAATATDNVDDDIEDGITTDPNGYDVNHLNKRIRVTAKYKYNPNIVAYMITKGCTLDTPGLNANLLIATRYDEHGCYLRSDDFVTRLPFFLLAQSLVQPLQLFQCRFQLLFHPLR